jgi:hypothetical protein
MDKDSASLIALTQQIQRKLLRAVELPSQRRNLLQELFADIALEVDEKAKDIMIGDEDVISPEAQGSEVV